MNETWSPSTDTAVAAFNPAMTVASAGRPDPVSVAGVPPVTLPRAAEITDVLALGYGGTESYGFHTLEVLQCMVERRKGGEVGVSRVQYVPHGAMFKALDDGRWSKELLEVGLATIKANRV